jgi:hypothetical protein
MGDEHLSSARPVDTSAYLFIVLLLPPTGKSVAFDLDLGWSSAIRKVFNFLTRKSLRKPTGLIILRLVTESERR